MDILLTLDGDLHLVARANNSTMGVAFPSFEVFLKDGSAQKLHTEYVWYTNSPAVEIIFLYRTELDVSSLGDRHFIITIIHHAEQ